ncbi:MAG TPA: glycine cleavage T C-terminal barrel domain-containing protein [Baekduia sp.]|uniref:glycine cleavage T C-terminal barrel domain-containing protein n=1 Tax=Baekduia sp. TaxID=2600305 RepID=UPI002D786256|nr:glycine cleavage T C-terminal barrel domain-containing protein [Baekduia sp.]HET6509020.1 glycine cleavage T C-terminal barrel domain-containing protein [Baekduia sp.]
MTNPTIEALRRPIQGYLTDSWGMYENTGWIDEQLSWKTTCYIGDWSGMPKGRLTGPDALKLLSDTSVNTFESFPVGRAKHIVQCDERGKIIGEGIAMPVGEQEYLLHSTPMWVAHHEVQTGRYDARHEPADMFLFQVSGPTAIHAIEKVCGESVRDIKFMHFRNVTIAGHEVIALRQGMAGEVGFELQGPRAIAQEVYDAVWEAGQELGMRKLGGRTVMQNHLEAYFPTGGKDYLPAVFTEEMSGWRDVISQVFPMIFDVGFRVAGSYESDDVRDWYRSPVEFGWGKNIKFDHDFKGADALRVELESPRRLPRTLVWNPEDLIDVYASFFRKEEQPYHFMEIPMEPHWYMWTDQVLAADGTLVGETTSRGYSYFFREMISIATIAPSHAEIGTEVTVLWGNPGEPQKRVRAKVAPAPYKPDNRRADLTALPATAAA